MRSKMGTKDKGQESGSALVTRLSSQKRNVMNSSKAIFTEYLNSKELLRYRR
jgi:hypothetical protein